MVGETFVETKKRCLEREPFVRSSSRISVKEKAGPACSSIIRGELIMTTRCRQDVVMPVGRLTREPDAGVGLNER
jgi:hypothetical protein